MLIYVNNNLKNLRFFCGKRDAFDCAGIRTQATIERAGLESRHSRKRLFFYRKIKIIIIM